MKKLLVTTLCLTTAFAGELLSSTVAQAQNPIYGKGQGYADQVVLDRMYLRRLKAKQARQKGTKKGASSQPKRMSGGNSAAKSAASPANKIASFSYPSVHIKRDSYQQFHLDDAKGYKVNFRLTPMSNPQKAVLKSYTYNFYDETADFGGLAPGRYVVKAEAIYGGKKYPAHIGSEYGTPSNPTGGNFAPTMSIEIKLNTDRYGYRVLESSPNELQVRVIE